MPEEAVFTRDFWLPGIPEKQARGIGMPEGRFFREIIAAGHTRKAREGEIGMPEEAIFPGNF